MALKILRGGGWLVMGHIKMTQHLGNNYKANYKVTEQAASYVSYGPHPTTAFATNDSCSVVSMLAATQDHRSEKAQHELWRGCFT